MKNRITQALACLLFACGCNVDKWDPPLQPTADYPCTRVGVVCPTQHTCCPQYHTCGGEPESVGCPAGQCCDAFGAARDGDGDAGTGMVPQRPQFNQGSVRQP